MLIHRVREIASSIVKLLDDETYAIRRLKKISEGTYDRVLKPICEAMVVRSHPNQSDKISDAWIGIKDSVEQVKSTTSFSELVRNIDSIIEELNSVEDALPEAKIVTDKLYYFSRLYEAYIDSQHPRDAAKLYFDSANIYREVVAFRETLAGMTRLLSNDASEVAEEEEMLTLVLNADTSEISSITDKLDALAKLYATLCELAGIDSRQEKLRVVRVETGSLFIAVVGSSIVIPLLKRLILKTVQILYRRYTVEGRIEAERDNRKDIADALKLRNELRDAGIESDLLDEKLKEMAESSAESLQTLLYGQTSVRIDETETNYTEPIKLPPTPRLEHKLEEFSDPEAVKPDEDKREEP